MVGMAMMVPLGYALLTHLVAHVTGLQVGKLHIALGDVHLYLNHVEAATTQLARQPKPLPSLWINPGINNIDDFRLTDVKLLNYDHHPTIAAPIAV